MIEMNIKGIIVDPATAVPIVILMNEEKNLVFPLFIGPFEANAIAIELKGLKAPRPLTHDVLVKFLLIHGIKMKYLYIYNVFEDMYFAKIVYRKGFRNYKMELRPSDGIAVALRMKAPIFVEERVIQSNVRYEESIELFDQVVSEDASLLFINNDRISDCLM